MTIGIVEPILAGLTVGIINKWILNNSELWHWCVAHSSCSNVTTVELNHHEDDLSSSNTTVSDISLENIHITHVDMH
jgi:hypothetical protein